MIRNMSLSMMSPLLRIWHYDEKMTWLRGRRIAQRLVDKVLQVRPLILKGVWQVLVWQHVIQLDNNVIQAARKQGERQVVLETSCHQTAALSFYYKTGWTEVKSFLYVLKWPSEFVRALCVSNQTIGSEIDPPPHPVAMFFLRPTNHCFYLCKNFCR